MIRSTSSNIRRLAVRMRGDRGQTMAEYAVILAVIIIAALVAIQLLAGGIDNALRSIVDILPGNDGTTTP